MASIPFPSLTTPPYETIRDLEMRMEEALDRLRLISAAASPEDALSLLLELRSLFIPPRYRATVQLEEDGRKKRSTAAASNWDPANGEVVLYFEAAAEQPAPPLRIVPPVEPRLSAALKDQAESTPSPDLTNVALQQCCSALADAERTGKHFIALKWFRDSVLPALPFDWAKSAEERQCVLTQAIESGAITARKIPNPKSPAFPTTTLILNRTSESPVHTESRFKPVPIKGEPGSVTLLRDRGSY